MKVIKSIWFTIAFILIVKFSYSQNNKIDGRINISNLSELVNDSFYFLENDTIFFAVYYPQNKQNTIKKYYLKRKKEWVYLVDNTVIEKGRFRRKRYPFKYIFREKIKEVEKYGEWYYK